MSTQSITLTELPNRNPAPSGNPITNSSEPLDINFAEDENAAGASGQYPRADGGKDAWLFLAGCFAVEMLVWYVLQREVCQCSVVRFHLAAEMSSVQDHQGDEGVRWRLIAMLKEFISFLKWLYTQVTSFVS